MTITKQKAAARRFADAWKDKVDEKQGTQSFSMSSMSIRTIRAAGTV